jgi:hypothetical protein
MRTPAGTECRYYFEDFHRGREVQTCRLIESTPNGGEWTPAHCSVCEVPRILMANGCPNLVLEARATRGFLGLGKRVKISAHCTRTERVVEEPQIGCGECHLELSNIVLPEADQ